MAHSGEDEPKYSSFWDCTLHLKWTFPDLASESRASPTCPWPPPLPNEYIIIVAPAYVQVSVILK